MVKKIERNFFAQRKAPISLRRRLHNKQARHSVKLKRFKERCYGEVWLYVASQPRRWHGSRAQRLSVVLSYPPGWATAWGDVPGNEILKCVLLRARTNLPGHIGPLCW